MLHQMPWATVIIPMAYTIMLHDMGQESMAKVSFADSMLVSARSEFACPSTISFHALLGLTLQSVSYMKD